MNFIVLEDGSMCRFIDIYCSVDDTNLKNGGCDGVCEL